MYREFSIALEEYNLVRVLDRYLWEICLWKITTVISANKTNCLVILERIGVNSFLRKDTVTSNALYFYETETFLCYTKTLQQ